MLNLRSIVLSIFASIMGLLCLLVSPSAHAQGLQITVDSLHRLSYYENVGATGSSFIKVTNISNVNVTFHCKVNLPFTVDTTSYTLVPGEKDSVLFSFEADTIGAWVDSVWIYSDAGTYTEWCRGETTDTTLTQKLWVSQWQGYSILKDGQFDSVQFWIHNDNKRDITIDSIYRERAFADSTTYHNVNGAMERVAGIEDSVFWYSTWPATIRAHDSASYMMYMKASRVEGNYGGSAFFYYHTPDGQRQQLWTDAGYYVNSPDNCYTITAPQTIGPAKLGDTIYDTIYVHNQSSESITFRQSTFENDIRPVWRFLNSWPQTLSAYSTRPFVFRFAPMSGVSPQDAIGKADQYHTLFPDITLTPACNLYMWYMRVLWPTDHIPIVEQDPPTISVHHGVNKTLKFYNDLGRPLAFTNIAVTNNAYSILSTSLPVSGKLNPGEQFNVTLRTEDASSNTELHLVTQTDLITLARLRAASADVTPTEAPSAKLTVWPNPAVSRVTITTNGFSTETEELLDILGRVIMSKPTSTIATDAWTLDTKSLRVPAGSYFVRVSGFATEGTPITLTQRLVIE